MRLTRWVFLLVVLPWAVSIAPALESIAAATPFSIQWTAPGDDGLVGRASAYELRYSNHPLTVANFGLATRLLGLPAPTLAVPGPALVLSSLYPNPTRESVRWSFSLPQAAPVHVAVFDILGRHVHTVENGERGAGADVLAWDLRDEGVRRRQPHPATTPRGPRPSSLAVCNPGRSIVVPSSGRAGPGRAHPDRHARVGLSTRFPPKLGGAPATPARGTVRAGGDLQRRAGRAVMALTEGYNRGQAHRAEHLEIFAAPVAQSDPQVGKPTASHSRPLSRTVELPCPSGHSSAG